jgi:hypothetical protein
MTVIGRRWRLIGRERTIGTRTRVYVEVAADGPALKAGEMVEVVPAEQLRGAVDVLRKIAADEGVVHDGIIDTDVPRQTAQAYLDAHGGGQ